jgi:dipeptidyl aminopeptidase/acylaminoacyl peptidase
MPAMSVLALLLWILQPPPAAPRAQPPPDTEIVLASLTKDAAGMLAVSAAENVTRSPGYDNQPSFTPDGAAMLFTSARGGTATDIYRYDLATRQLTRVTATPESEYSPTVTPDGAHISVIRVEADGTQRLWRFTLDGRQPELVLADIKPVGYHAWADDHTLALFVLGQPATLQLADTRTGRGDIVGRDIGRTIQRIPGGRTISFVARVSSDTGVRLMLSELDPATRKITSLVAPIAGVTEAYYAWTPDGTLLMADGNSLHAWRRGQRDWTRVAELRDAGLAGVTRIAVSPRGDRIAFVTEGR